MVKKGQYITALEKISPDENSSFHIMVNPKLHDFFFWHFHPEIELVYIDGADGTRHVGDHISKFKSNDLVLIGSYIPHLNFDYGIKTDYEKIVLHIQEDFLADVLIKTPELKSLSNLFEKASHGICFGKKTIEKLGARLKKLHEQDGFKRFLEVLDILQYLSIADDYELLHELPYQNSFHRKEQERLGKIYDYIHVNYTEKISIEDVALLANLGPEAFCRYFKKMTRLSFVEFLNRYRISQSKRLLRTDRNISEVCFQCGFESLSYFNRIFKKYSAETPSSFKKRFMAT
ncbi:MAG: AraC family transcriptional regulator [Bacteroidota bacterium]|jgi:AraC-like DNA-binding protein